MCVSGRLVGILGRVSALIMSTNRTILCCFVEDFSSRRVVVDDFVFSGVSGGFQWCRRAIVLFSFHPLPPSRGCGVEP